jgi:hypothetical protein
MSKFYHLRLILDVDYKLNGTPPEDLKYFLADIANRAAGDGLMTHDTPAEVENWGYTIFPNQLEECK